MSFKKTQNNRQHHDIWSNLYVTKKIICDLPLEEQLRFLIHAGHLAPSTHNAQPWAFAYDLNTQSIKVFLDRRYVLSESDKHGRQSLISMGCAIQNISVASSACGIKNTIAIHEIDVKNIKSCCGCKHAHRYILIATIKLAKKNCAKIDNAFIKTIFTRSVTRAEFNPQLSVQPNLLLKFEKIATSFKVRFHGIKNQIIKMSLAEFQAQADGFVINSKSFSKELGDWLLPNDTDAKRGMPGITFGLTDEESIRLHNGLIGKEKLRPEDGLKFALAGKNGIEKSPLLGVITTKSDTPLDWISTGRALEYIFLTASLNGFSLAIHAGVVEVPLVNRLFSISIGTTRHVTSVFRIGKPLDKSVLNRPHSPRAPLEDVILNNL